MTGLLSPVALFLPGTTHDYAIWQAGPSILSRRRLPNGGNGGAAASAGRYSAPAWLVANRATRPRRRRTSARRRRSPEITLRGLLISGTRGYRQHSATGMPGPPRRKSLNRWPLKFRLANPRSGGTPGAGSLAQEVSGGEPQ